MVFVSLAFNTDETSVGAIQRIYDSIKPILIKELNAKEFGIAVFATRKLYEGSILADKPKKNKKKQSFDDASYHLKSQKDENLKIFPKSGKTRDAVVKKFKEENKPLSNFL